MEHRIRFRKNLIYLPQSEENNTVLAMSAVAELMQFGFLPSAEAREMLERASKTEIINFHDQVISYLKSAAGAESNYRPFWKGFPQEVMEKTEVELWLHQIIHYLSNGNYEPNEWTRNRPQAFEQPKYTIYKTGSEDSLQNIFTDLVSTNQSLTPQDLADVKWIAENSAVTMPKVVPFKETLCALASLGLDVPVKSVTDVLRIAVGMSGGDVSLPKVPRALVRINAWSPDLGSNPEREKFKFRKFKRAERRRILELFEKTNCDPTEAVLKDQRFVRLGEILHPGEYQRQFPKAFQMFDRLRNQKVTSWYGKVEQAFKISVADGLNVLAERPGEFMRRLDWLVRTFDETEVLKAFRDVADRVSNKVLFEAYAHFERRTHKSTNRTVMIKGARKRTRLPDLPALNPETVSEIKNIIKTVLLAKFSMLPSLGMVWIDEELKNIPLPANMRSLSAALRPTIRGQRTKIGNQNAKVVRAYVHWFDAGGNEDIDLTATFVGLGRCERIGWNGTHNSALGCYSGDVRHRQGACAEYIDVNVEEAFEAGHKYVVLDARNYNGRGLDSVKQCAFGYMERQFPKANEIFVPSTLANAVLLQSPSATTIVAILDLESLEYIFLDIDQSGIPVASANVEAILFAIKLYCEPPTFSVYDLLAMHAAARGAITADRESAETRFEYAPFAESYGETLKFMGI
jgi:hypothetical protein